MWIRAVWKEGNREEEGTLPAVWVRDGVLFWPPGVNAEKAMAEKKAPAEKWRQFKLIKIKIKSDSRKECEDFDETTALENSDSEDENVRRPRKKKDFTDFVTDAVETEKDSETPDPEETLLKEVQLTQKKQSNIDLPTPPAKVKSSLATQSSAQNIKESRSSSSATRSPSEGRESERFISRSKSRLNSPTPCERDRGQHLKRKNSNHSLQPSRKRAPVLSDFESRSRSSSPHHNNADNRKTRSRSGTQSPEYERCRNAINSSRSRSPTRRSRQSKSHTRITPSQSRSQKSRSPFRASLSHTHEKRTSRSRSRTESPDQHQPRAHKRTARFSTGSPYHSRYQSRTQSRSPTGRRTDSRHSNLSQTRISPSRSRSQKSRSPFIASLSHTHEKRTSRSRSRTESPDQHQSRARKRIARCSPVHIHTTLTQRSKSRTRSPINLTSQHRRSGSDISFSSSRHPSTSRQQESRPIQKDTNRVAEKGNVYPMDNAKFQKRVLFLLADIRQELQEMKSGRCVVAAPGSSEPVLSVATTLEEFNQQEDNLKKTEERQRVIQLLSSVGGLNLRDNVRKIMGKLMTNEVMAKFNVKGNGGKMAFGSTATFQIVRDVAVKTCKSTEHEATLIIGSCLKYAPDRRGGGGRSKDDQ